MDLRGFSDKAAIVGVGYTKHVNNMERGSTVVPNVVARTTRQVKDKRTS